MDSRKGGRLCGVRVMRSGGWCRRVGSYGMEAAVLLFGLPPGKRKEWGVFRGRVSEGWRLRKGVVTSSASGARRRARGGAVGAG